MRRGPPPILPALSLLLCVATACLWLRTLKRMDVLGHLSRSGPSYALITSPHALSIGSDNTIGAFAAPFTTVPCWIALSIPYGLPQTLHLKPQNLNLPHGDTLALGQTDITFTLRPDPPPAGFLGFHWDNTGATNVNLASSSVQISGDYDIDSRGSTVPNPAPIPIANRTTTSAWRLTVPLWFLTVLTAVLPLLQAYRTLRRQRRRRLGLCAACGYDLRASKERCPECQASIQSRPRRTIRTPPAHAKGDTPSQ